MKVTIKEFCDKNNIERKKTALSDFSDLYLEIYKKYKHERKEWESIEATGETIKRALLIYEEDDLKEYFGVK